MFYRSEEERERKEEKEKEWMESLSPGLKEALEAGKDKYFPSADNPHTSSVSQLCISQVEISDMVLLNKCDLQTEEVRVLIEGWRSDERGDNLMPTLMSTNPIKIN